MVRFRATTTTTTTTAFLFVRLLGSSSPRALVVEAQSVGLAEAGNAVLGSPSARALVCSAASTIGDAFDDVVAALVDARVQGTTRDVPLPYDELIVLGADVLSHPGSCDVELEVRFSLTRVVGTGTTNGVARVEGAYDPGATFCRRADGSWWPGARACFAGLRTSDVDVENEGALYEDFVRNHVNRQLDDKECEVLWGECAADDDEGEEEDLQGDNNGDESSEPVNICESFPNLPQCQEDLSSTDVEDGEDSSSSPEEPDTACDKFPFLPQCQADEDEDENEDPGTIAVCDQHPNLPGCQEDEEDVDPMDDNGDGSDGVLCDRFPFLPACQTANSSPNCDLFPNQIECHDNSLVPITP